MPTILVVDDSPVMVEMLSTQLRQQGLTVIEAYDGNEAIAKFQSQPPDLVVTDVVMPNKNGYELCRWIKSNSTVPVVFCTTKGEAFDKVWAEKQGVDAYITKPFHPIELLKTIRTLLKK
ncbi:MAG: response regulator [Oscillatoriales cyanobacterium SM2_2_1]|nr:response regulator [Oscillatoriales cyanobacterium SM2_2_1]